MRAARTISAIASCRDADPGQFGDFGTLDRRDIVAQKVKLVLCETPTVIGGHAFTTGKIKRNSMEHILPNSFVDFAQKDGAGCNAATTRRPSCRARSCRTSMSTSTPPAST